MGGSKRGIGVLRREGLVGLWPGDLLPSPKLEEAFAKNYRKYSLWVGEE